MTVTFDPTVPGWGDPNPPEQFDAVRENFTWLMIAAASTNFDLPGWDAFPSGPEAQPDSVEMTSKTPSDNRRMRWLFTWNENGSVESVARQYDRGNGDGYEPLPLGTSTASYTANGFWAGTVTS